MPKDAIALLKADHVKVRGLLDELAATSERAKKRRQTLLGEIARELAVHTRIEEEIFYPAFRQADGREHAKMTAEATEEHRAVDSLVLPDLSKTELDSVQFAGRAKVLKELVEHHADEEEKEMFPAARKALSKEALQSLGERMAARKEELLAQQR